MSSSRIPEKFKRALINLVELCKGLRACSIPSDAATNTRILKLVSIVKKIFKSTALLEAKINEYNKSVVMAPIPAIADGAKNPTQVYIEEEVASLKTKLVRNINKYKTIFIALAKDIGAKEKDLSALNKTLEDTLTNLRKKKLHFYTRIHIYKTYSLHFHRQTAGPHKEHQEEQGQGH